MSVRFTHFDDLCLGCQIQGALPSFCFKVRQNKLAHIVEHPYALFHEMNETIVTLFSFEKN